MKTIENRQTEVQFGICPDCGRGGMQGVSGPHSYFELAKFCLNRQPQGGFTMEEMAKRLRVDSALRPENPSADLEDADFDTLRRCVSSMTWPQMFTDLVEFDKYIKGLQSTPAG